MLEQWEVTPSLRLPPSDKGSTPCRARQDSCPQGFRRKSASLPTYHMQFIALGAWHGLGHAAGKAKWLKTCLWTSANKQFLHAPSLQDTKGLEAHPLAGVAPSTALRPCRPGPGLSPRTVRAAQALLSRSPWDHRRTQRHGRYWETFQRWRPSYRAAVPNAMHSWTKCVKAAKHSARFRLIKRHFYTARKALHVFVVSTSPQ